MSTTSLKSPAKTAKPDTAPPAVIVTPPIATVSSFGFADSSEDSEDRADAASEARAAAQSRTAGTGQSVWQEGVPVFKSTEGVHYLRLLPFPGQANLVEDVEDSTRKLTRWWARYRIYRISDRKNGQDSGAIVCKPGEDILQKARIELFKNPATAAAFRAKEGKVFDISCSERIVFLGASFDGKTLSDVELIDLPVSRPKNKNKPNDAPKRQIGDDIRDMPRLREDDPITMANLPPGSVPPLKFGQIYSIEKGRLIALSVQGKKENMQRTVEAKSVYPLSASGSVKPEFVEMLKTASAKFGQQPIESLLRYSTQEDQINWVQSLAPAGFAEVALRAMGVKNVPTAPAVAGAEPQDDTPIEDAPAF